MVWPWSVPQYSVVVGSKYGPRCNHTSNCIRLHVVNWYTIQSYQKLIFWNVSCELRLIWSNFWSHDCVDTWLTTLLSKSHQFTVRLLKKNPSCWFHRNWLQYGMYKLLSSDVRNIIYIYTTINYASNINRNIFQNDHYKQKRSITPMQSDSSDSWLIAEGNYWIEEEKSKEWRFGKVQKDPQKDNWGCCVHKCSC